MFPHRRRKQRQISNAHYLRTHGALRTSLNHAFKKGVQETEDVGNRLWDQSILGWSQDSCEADCMAVTFAP